LGNITQPGHAVLGGVERHTSTLLPSLTHADHPSHNNTCRWTIVYLAQKNPLIQPAGGH